MTRTVVGVLRGGPSSEYDFSLRSGAALLADLGDEHYDTRDIFVDRRGVWHAQGRATDPARALSQVDVAVNLLHGGPGEDGATGRILERLGVPYVGSRAYASALSLGKPAARKAFRSAGIRIPNGLDFSLESGKDTGAMAREVFARFGPPYIVKPASEGSSHGIRMAPSILALPDTLGDVLDAHGSALVEEYLVGPELTVGVVEGFRDKPLYALPPAEIRHPASQFLERTHLADGSVSHLCPSALTHAEKAALEFMAMRAHEALGLSHFSEADIILSRSGPVLLEVNAIPHVHEKAAFPRMLSAVGSSIRELFEHLIALARKRR